MTTSSDNFFGQFFFENNDAYSLIIEDDGAVAYAYLLHMQDIVSDVWLYNRLPTPDQVNWRDKSAMPFPNPARFTDNAKFERPIQSASELEIGWRSDQGKVSVSIRFGALVAVLESGVVPGWSNNVTADGPLARQWLNTNQ